MPLFFILFRFESSPSHFMTYIPHLVHLPFCCCYVHGSSVMPCVICQLALFSLLFSLPIEREFKLSA